MIQEKKVFTETFKIRSSEVRPDGSARLQTICDLLQEIAGNHALQLNLDLTQLHEDNLTWMLHRLDIRIQRYPKWREKVTVQTWPSTGDRLRAYRDFRVLDEEGNVLLKALSYWLMINLNTRRPVRMPEKVLALAPSDITHEVPVKEERPAPPAQAESKKTFTVRHSDLDVNGHVNNVTYVEWITESLSSEPLIQAFDIEFRAECEYGDQVTVRTGGAETGNTLRVAVINTQKDQLLATAEITVF